MKSQEETSAVIEAFGKVARPVMLHYKMNRQSCIEAARITVETLRLFRLTPHAYPVKLAVVCDSLKFAYLSGFTGEEKEQLQAKASKWVNRGEGWAGHVIVRCGDWIIDSSIDQCESLEHGFRVEPMVLTFQVPPGVSLRRHVMKFTGLSDDRLPIEVTYFPHFDDSFRKTDAWRYFRSDGHIAERIAREMIAVLGESTVTIERADVRERTVT